MLSTCLGNGSTSGKKTHHSPHDGFAPVTQQAEVRIPRQESNAKGHPSEIPAVMSPPSAAEGPNTGMPSQPGCC